MDIRSIARMSGLLLVLAAAGCAEAEYKTTDVSNLFEVTPPYVGVDEGTPQQFSATLGGDPVAVTWESSDPTKATVNATGMVTTIAPGFVAITATQTANTTRKKSASLTIFQLLGVGLTSGVGRTVFATPGAAGAQELYRIFVPSGTTNLAITLSGGTGDLDLYVRRATPPTTSSYTYVSWNSGNSESITVPNPASGTWYILVDVWSAGGNATLTATRTP
jgi:serine protease